jgi:hypothetical protein
VYFSPSAAHNERTPSIAEKHGIPLAAAFLIYAQAWHRKKEYL